MVDSVIFIALTLGEINEVTVYYNRIIGIVLILISPILIIIAQFNRTLNPRRV